LASSNSFFSSSSNALLRILTLIGSNFYSSSVTSLTIQLWKLAMALIHDSIYSSLMRQRLAAALPIANSYGDVTGASLISLLSPLAN